MEASIDRRDGVLWVRVSGRFAGDEATEFAEAIIAAAGDSDRAVLLDCEQLSFAGDTGIRALIMTAKHLMQRDTAFLLCAPSNALRAALHVSAIDSIAPIHRTAAGALASLGR